MGGGARKCTVSYNLPAPASPCPWSQHTYCNLVQFWDAGQGCTTVWTPSTWCLNTKHVMGWDENANPLSGQSKCLENQLFMLFQHFAGSIMVILCWRSTGRINRHFTMAYHLWRFFPLTVRYGQQVFLGSSTHNAQVQRQLRPLSRATKTSVFFHGADTTVVLRARNMGDAPGLVQARKSMMGQNQLTGHCGKMFGAPILCEANKYNK